MNYKRKEIMFFFITLIVIDFTAIINIIAVNYAAVEEYTLDFLTFKLFDCMNIEELNFEKLIISGLPYAIFGVLSAMIMYEKNCIDRLNIIVRYKSRADMMSRRLLYGALSSFLFVLSHLSIVMMSVTSNYASMMMKNFAKEILIICIQMIIYIYEFICICGIINFLYGEIITIVIWMILYIFDTTYINFELGEKWSFSLMVENINILTGLDNNYITLFIHIIFVIFISVVLVYVVRKRDIGIDGR